MQPSSKSYITLGIMSGTSLDGLDLCLSQFEYSQGAWQHTILQATTIEYSLQQRQMLANAYNASGRELAHIDAQFGKWLGEQAVAFLAQFGSGIRPDVIGSHGHTIFHEPSRGFSTQIGSGPHIAAVVGAPCVSNFRMGDVARGGQGAPLVPIGDEFLFPNYSFCLNLGGFANISFNANGNRIAFDICPVNMAINHLAHWMGVEMDFDGNLAKEGVVNLDLLNQLNALDYYQFSGSKSLGREWFEAEFLPYLTASPIPVAHKLRTVYEHIAHQIGRVANDRVGSNILVTGGGAKNKFLLERILSQSHLQLVVPDGQLIDFKEAHIFGFLALLFILRQNSALASVTGAKSDSVAGCLSL